MKDYLITDLSQLEGSCYFELMSGKYDDKCWNEGSLFIPEDYWSDFFDSVIHNVTPNYDYYEFNYISKEECGLIAIKFKELVVKVLQSRNLEELQGVIKIFYFSEEFKQDFEIQN